MVGKARSSNFTLSEKLDLLKLVKPYVKILEEHTNKHSVIVEKNKCWDIIADNYNAIGVDRPPRTAQGLRTLYKRLKEYAKQELLQQKETPSDCKSSISEPTKKVVEMIPQISNVCLRDRSGVQSASIDKETIAGTSSPQAMLDHHPATVMMELQSEEDVKPPPSLIIDSQQSENLEHEEEHQLVHIMERSPSTSVSSVDMRVMMSPSPVPRRDEFFRLEVGERFRPICGSDPQMLQMLKEEHQVILENQRKIGLYVQEKRDGLKRKQQLEEELLRTKIKVEKLKAIRLRRDLPEYSNAAYLPTSGTAKEEAAQEEPDCVTKYFSVVWCKASKKKHKKWEGDAVLVTKGKSVILKDMEGKDIGRGTGYKPKELDSLDEGQTLMIGGKEIEVMGVISADDFSSGRCFQTGIATHDTVPTALPQATMKRFCKPFKNVCQPNTKENILNNSQSCKPRHDPNASNSLVMPRPNASHQWMFNKAGLPVVDVVVDPYIANNLRPHQKEGIVFLYECVMGMRVSGRFGAILADEMGLGKTLQCISLVWTLLRQGVYGCKPVLKQALIVTPGSLVKNWKKEFQKWLGSERIKVFTVDQDHKVEEFISSPLYSVMIISYEMLLRSLEQIQAIEFNLLICDEGHRLKNSSIKTTTALTSLPCERRIILTGTPIQNDLQEFYALIEFVNPGVLGSLSTYRKIYEEPIVRSREPSATKEEKELGEKRAAELTRLTGLFILRRTQEVINKFLPPKKESIIFCRPTALQLELYRKLLSSQVIRSCLQGRLENSPHLICIGALKKLCNHPCLLFKAVKEKSCDPMNDEHDESSLYEGLMDVFPQDYTSDTFAETDSGKLQVLVKLLAAIHELNSSERVVLVSNYTQTLNILQETCKTYGYSYMRLDGHTPVSQRQHIVDSFNSKFSPAFIFLLSSKAGGVGLNLVGASHLILYDIDWNPATDIQAMARVWRDGQKHTVHIYRLLTTGSIEEKIYQRQISKQDLSGAVVDLSKTSEHIHFSVEELKNLFTLHEDSSCVTHDLLECDCMGNKDHQNPSSEKPSASRSCQLGQDQGKPNSKKPLSMSQLMQWKHFSGQHQALADPFLERIKENVSFIFQNVTSPTSPAQ